MHPKLPPILTLLLLAGFAGVAACEPHAMHMRMPGPAIDLAADSVVVPIRVAEGHVFVDVTIGGKGPFPFFFDTGAAGSVMDLAFARELGLPLGQDVMVGSPNGAGRPGHLVKLDTLRLGGLTLRGLTSVAFDGLPQGRNSSVHPRGVLGPYGLTGLLVTLDYPHQRLVFRRGALPPADGREIFAWDRGRPLPEIPVQVAGHDARVHLDSGAGGGFGLPVSFQGQVPLAGPLAEMGRSHTVDRDVVVHGARLAGDLVIGRYTLAKPMVRFDDVLKDVGNVGYGILGQFTITIDPAHARLRLAGPADGRLVMAETK